MSTVATPHTTVPRFLLLDYGRSVVYPGLGAKENVMNPNGVEISQDKIAELARKWRITEFALFGSVLRKDFGPQSDVDVLVAFEQEAL